MNNSESNKETAISWASGINLILGIWLFISAWALSPEVGAARTNDIVFGIIVVALSWIRLANRSQTGVASWLNVLAGIWLIIAPFAMHFQASAQTWNSVIIGIIVAVLAIVSGGVGATRHPAATA